MNALTAPEEIEKCHLLVRGMTLSDEYHEDDFRPEWIVEQQWTVVPVEDDNHFSSLQIGTIVATFETPVILTALR